jgi:CrcB protein
MARCVARVNTSPRPKANWPPEWLISIVVIGSGGFVGANARYALGRLAAATWGTSFPWGTLLINVSGSFALGLFVAFIMRRLSGAPLLRAFVATGFLGAFTTFSTFSYETVQLFLAGSTLSAVAYVAGSLILALGAAAAGAICAQTM